MRKKTVTLLAALFAGGGCGSATAPELFPGDAVGVEFERVDGTNNARFRYAQRTVIRDKKEFVLFWETANATIRPRPIPPDIDFAD